MVLLDNRSIQALCPRVFIPATEKEIKFTAIKQGAVLNQWTTQDQKSLFSVQATSWKFSNMHQLSERFALTHINSVYQKMELHGNIAYLWENKIIMILEHL